MFIKWEEQNEVRWKYGNNLPLGEKWGYDRELKFITNGMGEGFHIHGGTHYQDVCNLINALNKRDWEIFVLKKQIGVQED